MQQYTVIPSIQDYPPTAPWTPTDPLLASLVKQDKVYSYLKFDRTSNYKPNLCNSLGVMEQREIYMLLHSTLSHIGQGGKLGVEGLVEQLEMLEKLMVEWDLDTKLDCG